MSMKYWRQAYTEKFKFNWVPCIFILLNLAALSRKPFGLLAHSSTRKWRLSSAPHLGWFSSVSQQKAPDPHHHP